MKKLIVDKKEYNLIVVKVSHVFKYYYEGYYIAYVQEIGIMSCYAIAKRKREVIRKLKSEIKWINNFLKNI